MPRFNYPLYIQITLPDDYSSNATFRDELTRLKELGFSGVEVNIQDPSSVPYDELEGFLRSFGLEFPYFASGLTAKTEGLSLSHPDESVRDKSTGKLLECIEYMSKSKKRDSKHAGIIVGFFKGQATVDEETAKTQFKRSLDEIVLRADEKRVPVLIEATNRYETSVARSLSETVDLIKEYESSYIQILPDTFHMNIEEADMFTALSQALPYYRSVHLSDNTRFLPGYGAIDFKRVIDHLTTIGFNGTLSLEGQIKNSLIEDCKYSIDYLTPLLSEQ